jgi:Tetratricopeptide repeat./TIR domain.
MFEYDVFLSYSSKDKNIVHPLAKCLKQDGVRVWLDDWVIEPGDSIPMKIQEGLMKSHTLLMCMSPSYFESDWGSIEHMSILFCDPKNTKRRLIPLLIANCTQPEIIAHLKYIDWRAHSDEAYDKIIVSCLERKKEEKEEEEQKKLRKQEDERKKENFEKKEDDVDKINQLEIIEAKSTHYPNHLSLRYSFYAIFEKRLEECEESIKSKPNNAIFWNEKSICLCLLKRYYEALQAIDKAIELQPDNTNHWSKKNLILIHLSKYDEALQAIDKAIELQPDNASNWCSKGNTLRWLSKYDEALQAIDKAIVLDQNQDSFWEEKGNTLKSMGKHIEAFACFCKAKELVMKSAIRDFVDGI